MCFNLFLSNNQDLNGKNWFKCGQVIPSKEIQLKPLNKNQINKYQHKFWKIYIFKSCNILKFDSYLQ